MDHYSAEINKNMTADDLEEVRRRLFKENVRLQAERAQMENDQEAMHRERREIAGERRQLAREKRQLSIELTRLKESVEFERRRLKEDESVLDKKQKLIEHAYAQLDTDRRVLREERAKAAREREAYQRATSAVRKEVYATGLFFRGVNNAVALKKRYKELMKIYHPDNICGDQEMLVKINEEYEELREQFSVVSRQA